MNRILVIEDDVILGDMLSMYLTEEGYEVRQALTGQDGLDMLDTFEPNLLLLDLMLPDTEGIALCERIRSRSDVPIMVVSLKNEVSERVNALKAGADDYLCKPFSLHELTARVFALLRRSQSAAQARASAAAHASAAELTAASGTAAPAAAAIRLDVDRRTLYVFEQPIETTYSEFELMKLFISHPGRVFSREDLLSAIRGFDSFVTDRAIDVHIVNLRKKIEPDPRAPRFIKTVWGVGYKFEAGH